MTAPAASSAASAPGSEQLRREVDALRGLLDGHLPPELGLPALFEIDLDDATAVAQRVQALKDRLSGSPPPVDGGDGSAALRHARDTLRLAFLSLPAVRRDALR